MRHNALSPEGDAAVLRDSDETHQLMPEAHYEDDDYYDGGGGSVGGDDHENLHYGANSGPSSPLSHAMTIMPTPEAGRRSAEYVIAIGK